MTRRAGRPEVEPPFGNDFGNRFKRGLKEKTISRLGPQPEILSAACRSVRARVDR